MARRGRGNSRTKSKFGNRNDNSFIHDDDYFYSSQGLHEVDQRVDELLAFPSQEFNPYGNGMQGAASNPPISNTDSDSKLDKILYHIQDINAKFSNLTHEVGFLRRELTNANKNIAALQEKNKKLENDLKAKNLVNVDNLEREARKKCLILSGPDLKLPAVHTPYALVEEARRTLNRHIELDVAVEQFDDYRANRTKDLSSLYHS